MSSLTGKCAAQKIKKAFAVLVYGHVNDNLHCYTI